MRFVLPYLHTKQTPKHTYEYKIYKSLYDDDDDDDVLNPVKYGKKKTQELMLLDPFYFKTKTRGIKKRNTKSMFKHNICIKMLG